MDLQDFILTESLDSYYPFIEVDTTNPHVLAQYNFEVGGSQYSVRYLKAPEMGNRVSKIQLGNLRGKKITTKIIGVSNFKKFFSTIVNIVLWSYQNANPKVDKKNQGLAILFDKKDFHQYGTLLAKAVNIKLRGVYTLNTDTFDHPIRENLNVMYLTRRGKSFGSVFNALPDDILDVSGVYDDYEDEEEDDDTEDLATAFANIPLDSTPEIEEPPVEEPVSSEEEEGETSGSDLSGTIPISQKYTEHEQNTIGLEALLRAYVDKKFSLTKIAFEDSTHFSSSLTLEQRKIAASWIINNDSKLPLVNEYLLVLAFNFSGIRTGHIYDAYDHNQESGIYGFYRRNFNSPDKKSSFSKSITSIVDNISLSMFPEKKDVVEINDVDFNIIENILKNAEQIVKNKGGEINQTNLNQNKPNSISTINKMINVDEMSKEELVNTFNEIAVEYQGVEPSYKYMFNKEEDGVEGGKQLDVNNDPRADMLRLLGKEIFERYDSTDIDEYCKKLPKIASFFVDSGFYVEGLDEFKAGFVSKWTLSGGGDAQYASMVFGNAIGVNKEELQMWEGENENKFKLKGKSELASTNLQRIYDETQAFFKGKYKNYDSKTIKLYRGVGKLDVKHYVPAALESWTTELSTAKRFAKFMSESNKKAGTILYAEVPLTSIWATYATLSGWFPPEKSLNGKKEHIVLGGIFDKVPIMVYNQTTKTPEREILSFNEWKENIMNEAEDNDNKQIDVIFTNNKEIQDDLEDEVAFGYEESESLLKKESDS